MRLLFVLFFVATFSNSLFASDESSQLLPQIKKILITQAQSFGSYQLAYGHIKKVANDAIEFNGEVTSVELEAAFNQIEKEFSYEVMTLNRAQLAKLILKALNS